MKDFILEVKSLINRMEAIDCGYSSYNIINEDRASKQSDKSKKLIRRIFPDKNLNACSTNNGKPYINIYEEFIREKFQIKSNGHPESPVSYEFEPGITRIAYTELFLDPITHSGFSRITEGFKNALAWISQNQEGKFDENLNGWCLSDFVREYPNFFEEEIKSYIPLSNSGFKEKQGKYRIVEINNFNDASEYCKYFTDTTWCITQESSYFSTYSEKHSNKIYFCLMDNFENIKANTSDDYPYDEYGVSMISVIISPNGKPKYITLRWNHKLGAPGDRSFDLDVDKFSNFTGIDFYATFKPYTREEIDFYKKNESACGEIGDFDYYSLLKGGPISGYDGRDEISEKYYIVYYANESIYQDEDGEWVYSDPVDSPDYDEGDDKDIYYATLEDESVAYIIDNEKHKIVKRIETKNKGLCYYRRNKVLTYYDNLAGCKKVLYNDGERENVEDFKDCKAFYAIKYVGSDGYELYDIITNERIIDEKFNTVFWCNPYGYAKNEKNEFFVEPKSYNVEPFEVETAKIIYNLTETHRLNNFSIYNDEASSIIYTDGAKTYFRHFTTGKTTSIDGLWRYKTYYHTSFGYNLYLVNEQDEVITAFISSNGVSILPKNKNKEIVPIISLSGDRIIVRIDKINMFNVYNTTEKRYEFRKPFTVIDSISYKIYKTIEMDGMFYLYDGDMTHCIFKSQKEIDVVSVEKSENGFFILFKVGNEKYVYDTGSKLFFNRKIIALGHGFAIVLDNGVKKLFAPKEKRFVEIEIPEPYNDKSKWDFCIENSPYYITFVNKQTGEKSKFMVIYGRIC